MLKTRQKKGKMNKFVSSLAVFAATTAVVSCSESDALADVQEPVGGSQTIRFAVSVDHGDITRAQRITTADFTEYQVWATNGDTKKPWLSASTIEGVFNNDVWKETSNTATWDNLSDKANPNTFFALSANGGKTSLANAGLTLTELADNDNAESNQEVAADKYLDYAMPTSGSQVDITKQVDLMAAYTPGIAKNAPVALNFKHILSNIEIKVLLTDAMWNPTAKRFDNVDDTQWRFDEDSWFYISYIIIHGLKANGQYTFSNGTWTTSGDAVDIKIPIDKFFYFHDLRQIANEYKDAHGLTDEELVNYHTEIEHSVYDDALVDANSIMVIPQQGTPWDYLAAPTSSDCCVEVYGVSCSANEPIVDQAAHEAAIRSHMNADGTWKVDEKGWGTYWYADEFGNLYFGNEYPATDEEGPGLSGYYQLSTKFEPGKKYTIWLNLGRIRYEDGTPMASV